MEMRQKRMLRKKKCKQLSLKNQTEYEILNCGGEKINNISKL